MLITTAETPKREKEMNDRPWGKRGFTLMEMVVSLGIFATVMISATGIIIMAQNAQLKTRNLQNVQDNIRFVLEYLTKELRTGDQFSLCPWNSIQNGKIVFINDLGMAVGYQYNNTADVMAIERFEYAVGVPTCSNTNNTTIPPSNILSGGQITTNEVSIERMVFHTRATIGMSPGPADGQPRIVVSVRVRSRAGKAIADTVMNIQTTITPRVRDDTP